MASSFLSNFSSMLGGNRAPEAAPVAQPNTPPAEGGQQQQPQQPPQAPVGLDAFTEIMQAVAPQAPESFDANKLLAIDDKQLASQIGNVNFMQGVATPELLQQIEQGGSAGVQAMLQMMNGLAQRLTVQNTLASRTIASESLNRSVPHLDQMVNRQFQNRDINSAVTSSHETFSHPAMQPVLNAIIPQIRNKFPNASPAEVASYAKDFMTQMATQLAGPKQAAATPAAPAETDWFNWENR